MRNTRKEGDVQRGLRAHKPGSVGIGRVGRVYRRESKEEKIFHRDHREGSSRSSGRRANRAGVMAWSLLALAGTVGILATAFVLWLLPRMREKDPSGRSMDDTARNVRVAAKFEAPSQEFSQRIVANALAVAEEADVDRWVRRGDVPAAEVIAFMRDINAKDGAPTERQWLGGIDRNGMQLEGIELIYVKEEETNSRLALLVPDEKGVWKMDYGAFARTMNPSWEELVAPESPAGSAAEKAESLPKGILRALFLESSYFNGPFNDDSVWVAYGMVHIDHRDVKLMGYCKNGSRQHKALTHILSKWPEDVLPRITVEVRRVAGGEATQFEIVSVLAEDWAVGDRKFEDLTEEGWR